MRIETPGGLLEEIAMPSAVEIEEIRKQTLSRTSATPSPGIREMAPQHPAPKDIRNRILFERTRPHPRRLADSPLFKPEGLRDTSSGMETTKVRKGLGFSARTVDERVRPYCPFPHRTRPPERTLLPAPTPCHPIP